MFADIYIAMKLADIVAFIFVFPGSVFIIAIYLWNWLNRQTLSIPDHLIAGQSVYNFINGVMKVTAQLFLLLRVDCLLLIKCLSVSYLMIMSGSLCFCTWFSIYICLKIVTFSQNWYMCFQKIFPKLIPWIVIGTVFITLLVGVIMVWDIRDEAPPNRTDLKQDLLLVFYLPDSALLKVNIATYIFALLLFASSFAAIITSLCRHIKVMRSKVEELTLNVNVHIHAVKMLTVSFIYNILYFINIMLICFKGDDIVFLYFLSIISSIGLVLNTFILIKGNSKLNSALDQTLKLVFCWLK